jgi:hypothetical protein
LPHSMLKPAYLTRQMTSPEAKIGPAGPLPTSCTRMKRPVGGAVVEITVEFVVETPVVLEVETLGVPMVETLVVPVIETLALVEVKTSAVLVVETPAVLDVAIVELLVKGAVVVDVTVVGMVVVVTHEDDILLGVYISVVLLSVVPGAGPPRRLFPDAM